MRDQVFSGLGRNSFGHEKPAPGIEPGMSGVAVHRLATWLRRREAPRGIRTPMTAFKGRRPAVERGTRGGAPGGARTRVFIAWEDDAVVTAGPRARIVLRGTRTPIAAFGGRCPVRWTRSTRDVRSQRRVRDSNPQTSGGHSLSRRARPTVSAYSPRLTEGEGFEPPEPRGPTLFESARRTDVGPSVMSGTNNPDPRRPTGQTWARTRITGSSAWRSAELSYRSVG